MEEDKATEGFDGLLAGLRVAALLQPLLVNVGSVEVDLQRVVVSDDALEVHEWFDCT